MGDPLATYLEDHIAGASYAIDLLGAIRDQHAGEPLAEFALGMLAEVKADEAALKGLAERVGSGVSSLKIASAWLTEKVSRLKLSHESAGGLGTFQALEFLAVGIQGKLALWRALAVASAGDDRLNQMDFDHLARRAESQHARMETQRLEAARTVFRRAQ